MTSQIVGNADVAPLYATKDMRERIERCRFKLDVAKQSRRRYEAVLIPVKGARDLRNVKRVTVESVSIAQARLDIERICRDIWPGVQWKELTITMVVAGDNPLPFGRTFKG